MAATFEELQQQYLKEKQEYQDAVAAYEQTLNQVASSMPIPAATLSNYSVVSGGYQRAATDPWMSQNHPELAAAATRLAKEERDYLALDDPSANYGSNSCGIGTYIGNRFYEYVALAEMLYTLSTDEDFRKAVVAKLGEAVESGGIINDFFTVMGTGFAIEGLAHSGGNQQVIEANEAMIAAGKPAVARFTNRVRGYFADKWNAFLQGWEECGLASAVQRAGVDGLFLVGEIVTGAAVIKGVKFSYNLTKEGLHRVEIMSVDTGKTVGERSWSAGALDAKYKAANDNHVGGKLEDRNGSIPDKPAEDMVSKQSNGADASEVKRPPRSREELLPNGEVPLHSNGKGKFVEWWNDLSKEELDLLWSDPILRKDIEDQVRLPGKLHEWLMTGQGPKIKELGFTMNDIKAMTTPTKEASGRIPGTNERWRHTTDEGKTGYGSKRMHNALKEAIVGAEDRADLLKRLDDFSRKWLDDGPDSFPAPLRDMIKSNRE